MGDKEIEILLVEDNEYDAELTLRAFRKHKLVNIVKHVKDGEEALDYLFCQGQFSQRKPEDNPRFILLDIKLPKLNGIEVLKQIRQNEITKFLPVVMLTSSNEEKDLIESYSLGANSYITKPVQFDKFMEAVSHVGYYWLLLNKLPYHD
jgi:CheY-like chemotaxis protein